MNVHLIVRRLTATVLVTKMHLMMLTVTVGTAKKWKGCVLTTRVAKSVVGIRTTATVLATAMPRSKGSLNKKGKQSVEERTVKRRETSSPKTAESRSQEYAQLKLKRRENKIANLTNKIKEKRQALLQLGRFADTSDPAYRKMQRLIQGEME